MSCGEISLLLCVLILSAVIGVSPAVGRASPMGAETFPFRRYHGQLVSDVEQKDPGYIRWLEGQPDVAKKYPTLSLRLTQKPSAAASVGIGSPVSPAHGEEKLSASLEQEQPAPPSVEMGCISPASVDVGSPVSSSPGDGDHGEICWRGKHKGRPVSDIHKEDPDHFARTLKYRPQDAIKDPHYHAFLERHRSPPISPNQRNLSSWTMTDWRSSPETQPPATPPREGAQRANATRNVEDTPLPPPHSPAQRKRTNAPAATPSPRSPPPRSPSTSRPGSPASPGRGGRTNAPSSRRSPRARSPSSPNAPRAASATSPPSQLSPLRLEATKRRSPRKGQAGPRTSGSASSAERPCSPLEPVEPLPESRLKGRHYLRKGEPRRRCRLCTFSEQKGSAAYESRIQSACKQCNVSLHFECFEEFHEKPSPVSQWTGGA